MGPHGERGNISDPGGIRTHNLSPEQVTVALPTELQGQMGAAWLWLIKMVISGKRTRK